MLYTTTAHHPALVTGPLHLLQCGFWSQGFSISAIPDLTAPKTAGTTDFDNKATTFFGQPVLSYHVDLSAT